MRQRRCEAGFSLIPAMAMLGLLIMLGGVAVQEGVQALGNTRDNELRERALQTADVAVDAAVYQLNRADLSLVGTGTVGGADLAQMPVGDPAGRGGAALVSSHRGGEDAGGGR